MLGYNYEIIYKKGKDSVVVDALSRKYEDDRSLFALSSLVPKWLDKARQEWIAHASISQLIEQLREDPNPPRGTLGNKIPCDIKVVFSGT